MGRKKKDDSGGYDANAIQVLKGLKGVRRRPAMYIGDTAANGLHHLIEEVVDNSIDEALSGHCTKIDLVLEKDGSVSVTDDGRGIPTDTVKGEGKSGVEVVMTVLHSGAKFDRSMYKCAGGLHGVGVSCVNALSEWLEVEVHRNGHVYRQRFERGAKVSDLKKYGKTRKTGTKIRFKPDADIFKETMEFKYNRISKRFRELSFLNSGLVLCITDKRGKRSKSKEFCSKKGLEEYVTSLNENEKPLFDSVISLSGKQASAETNGEVHVDVAIGWNKSYKEQMRTYVNNIETIEGGSHLKGFRNALTKTMNSYIVKNPPAKKLKGKKKSELPDGVDYREGLVAIISTKVPEPQFEGQTKTKLGNSEVAGIVQAIVSEQLDMFLEKRPDIAQKVIKKAALAQEARLAARKAKEQTRTSKTRASRDGDFGSKLSDCTSRSRKETEIFLVEGDSAGGTAKQARNPHIQAILPLRGKILNVWKSSKNKTMTHKEIQAIYNVLGTGIMENFDAEKCRYGKIIIMCDADVDGSHIRTLILTFFFRQMRQLIADGKVYVAQPPLYGARRKNQRRMRYIIDEAEFQKEVLKSAIDGASLLDSQTGHIFKEDELDYLINTYLALQRIERASHEHPVSFDRYIANPLYASVKFTQTGRVISFERPADFRKWVKAVKNECEDLDIWRSGSSIEERDASDIQVTIYRSKDDVEGLLEDLSDYGIEPEAYSTSADRFMLRKNNTTVTLDSLRDVVSEMYSAGQRGMVIKRFKGLGEMNAGELWDTTMDPDNRVLKQMSMDDEKEANEMFLTLMGSAVDKRREFIERHALDVTGLDV